MALGGWGLVALGTALAPSRASAQLTYDITIGSTNGGEGRILGDATGTALQSARSNATNSSLRVGDSESGTVDQGYASMLSFQTSSIPGNAVINKAELITTRGATVGDIGPGFNSPPIIEVKTGIYGRIQLQASDFNEPSTASPGGFLVLGAADGDTTTSLLNDAGRAAVNKSGGPGKSRTQMKLRYSGLTDNDGQDDYIGIYSTKTGIASRRPQLKVNVTIPASNIVVSPAGLDFLDVDVDSGASTQPVVIQNLGNTNLTINSITLGGVDAAQFAITSDTGETLLAPNATRTLQVRFTPAFPQGDKNASIVIASSDPTEPSTTVLLNAFVYDQEIDATPTAMDFGSGEVGSPAGPSQFLFINNIGLEPEFVDNALGVSKIQISGTDKFDFNIVADTGEASVLPGAPRVLTINFAPSSPAGPKSATLTITSDDTDEPTVDIPLTGLGVTGPTPIPTETPSATPSETPTPSPTESLTPTPSETPSVSPTASETPTGTPSETPTPSPTEFLTPTVSETPSVSPTVSDTPTQTPTETPTETPTPTASETPSASPSQTPSPSPSPTASFGDILDYLLGRANDPTGLDVQSDAAVDIADLIANELLQPTLSSRILAYLTGETDDPTGLDVNGDNVVDIADYLAQLLLES